MHLNNAVSSCVRTEHIFPSRPCRLFPDRHLEVIAFCINASLLTGVCVCVRMYVSVCALSVCPSVGVSLVFLLTDAIGLLIYSTHSVTTQGQLLGSIRRWDLTEGCKRDTQINTLKIFSQCVWSHGTFKNHINDMCLHTLLCGNHNWAEHHCQGPLVVAVSGHDYFALRI